MKSFNRCICLSVFILTMLLCQSAFANSDSHRNAADELLDTMEMNTLIDDSIKTILQLELSKNPTLQPLEEVMRVFFHKHMSGESLRGAFIDIYVETFTEKELKEINRFYKTPTGKKVVKETPVLKAKGMKLGEQRVQENLPELQSMIQEEAARIRKMQQESGNQKQ